MTSHSGRSLVREFIDTMVSESRETAARRFLADGAAVTINGDEYDRETYLERLQTSDVRFDILDVEIEELIEENGVVALQQVLHFQHSGTAYGVEPEYSTFDETATAFFEVEDGSIVSLDIVHDPTATLEALGLLSEDRTTEKLRDQYYEVLNRVLRHNLRNQLNTIHARAELLEENPTEATAEIKTKINELLTTVEKARKIEQTAMGAPLNRETFAVEDAIETILEKYQERDDVSCQCTSVEPDLELTSDKGLFHNIVNEAVENAVLYSERENVHVRIDIEPGSTDHYAVELTITDNGPGIPESELEPLRQDRETQLLHGSGIGLWIVKWGVTRLQGEITFAQRSSSEVNIALPNLY